MANVNFIELYTNKTDALSVRTSPAIDQNLAIYKGVQLLPNNELPYVQTTITGEETEIDDWSVYVMNVCGNDPVTTGASNLLLYSNDKTNAVWQNTGLELDGDRVVATNSNSAHWLEQEIVKSASAVTYTYSMFVKYAEYSRMYIRVSDANGYIITYFNTNNQVFYNTDVDTFANLGTNYTDEGDGWYRVSLKFTTTNDTKIEFVAGIVNDSDDFIFVGDNLDGHNLSGLLLKNAQLQEGDLTDYLETTSTTASIDGYVGVDITSYFHIERAFNDTNGVAQVDWSLTNVPFDFGYKLIYLRIEQAFGETFYSTPFMITAHESEKTCRIDYRNREIDTMQSTQLPMYFWQNLKQTELNSYYEVSTRNTVTTLVKSQKYERWITKDVIDNDSMIKIDDAFENKFVYIDFYRCNLFEANEIKEFSASENFAQNILKLSFNKSDVYDPLYEEPVTTVLTPTITLSSVITSGINALYNFTFANFNPSFLTFQTSQDQVNWNSTNGATTSPFSLPFNGTGVWYFRITSAEAVSNIITLYIGINVDANNDFYLVQKGETKILDVLYNDNLVGSTTITSVTAPLNGTANIINDGTQIEYTHDNSDTTGDTFTYTISNGITSDTATIGISISSLISTLIIPFGSHAKLSSCRLSILGLDLQTIYHNGFGYPRTGDIIYKDDYVLFVGNNLWYQIEGNKTIKIDNIGQVIDHATCY